MMNDDFYERTFLQNKYRVVFVDQILDSYRRNVNGLAR
jgi:hypothetical protein